MSLRAALILTLGAALGLARAWPVFALAQTWPVFALAQTWDVPEDKRAVKNPLEVSPEVLAAGEASYKKQCVLCHGDAFKGDGSAVAMFQKKPPDLSTREARERLTDGEIFYKMTIGKTPMPAMETRLSEEERWQVVHYVRSLQAK